MVGGEQKHPKIDFILLQNLYYKNGQLTYSHYYTIVYNMNEWVIVAIILIVTGCIWVWSELMKK